MWSHGHGTRSVGGAGCTHRHLGKVQEGGACQESFGTSLEGPQGSFPYCDGATVTAPQQNPCFHPKRPEQQDSFPQGREQLRASSPGFLGPVGASGNPGCWATNGPCRLPKALTIGVGSQAAALSLTVKLDSRSCEIHFLPGLSFLIYEMGARRASHRGWL